MDGRKELENKFRCYQSMLAESCCSNEIDLDDIANTYCVMNDEGDLYIRYIPFKGDFVYLDIDSKQITNNDYKKEMRSKLELEYISDMKLKELLHIMRTAMIIGELRATLY